MAIVIGLGIAESVYSKNVYTTISKQAQNIALLLEDETKIEENSLKIETELEQIENTWLNFRKISLSFSNHTTINNFTEKLVGIKRYFIVNQFYDAYVSACTVEHLATHLASENGFSFQNLL